MHRFARVLTLSFGVMGCGGTTGAEGLVFACSEQGIREAIVEGGGPHAFDCDGPTTVVTEETIELGNDVILDGQGDLTVDGDEQHRVFSVLEGATAELRGLKITGGIGGVANAGALTVLDCTISGNGQVGHRRRAPRRVPR